MKCPHCNGQLLYVQVEKHYWLPNDDGLLVWNDEVNYDVDGQYLECKTCGRSYSVRLVDDITHGLEDDKSRVILYGLKTTVL